MKLIWFAADGVERLGALADGWCIDLNGAARLAAAGPQHVADSMVELIEAGEAGLARAAAALALATEADPVGRAGVAFQAEAVTFLPPVPRPSKLIAIGQNYRDHCDEQGIPVPDRVTVFGKFTTALTGHGQPIVLPPPTVSSQVDFEAELAVVIGREARNVAAAAALDHVFGYTCCHDVSARDVQFGDGGGQWLRGKSFDTFAPLGPCLVTADELPDPHTLDIRCELNGQVMQASNTRNLVFRIPWLISTLSQSCTLLPGDVIATGTPGGVGAFRQPPVWLQPGDRVTISIEGIGELTNPVVASPGNGG